MIPLPQLLAELMLGVGAALFGANLLALIRSAGRRDDDRRAHPRRPPPGAAGRARTARSTPGGGRRARTGPGRPAVPPSFKRVYAKMAIGLMVALLGLTGLLRQG